MFLPNELVDYTLSFLQTDTDTLKKCAQSHPILSELAKRYIYADITLLDFPAASGLWFSEFSQTLADSPEIANYVRSLTFFLHDGMTASYLDTITSILPMFSRLAKICLEGCTFYLVSWNKLPESFRQAFLHTLHIQSMKDISISAVESFPLSVLNNCSNITLERCSFPTIHHEEFIESLPCPPLEHLFIQHCDKSMEIITSWVQMLNLCSLRYCASLETCFGTCLPGLLIACWRTLTKLELDVAEFFQSRFTNLGSEHNVISHYPFTISGLFHLEKLTIHCGLRWLRSTIGSKPASFNFSPFPALTELISTAPCSLKRLYINVDLAGQADDFDNLVFFPLTALAAKCSSLSITVGISLSWGLSYGFQGDTVPSLVDCPGLRSYMEDGVIVDG